MASKDNLIAQDKDKSIEDVLQTHSALIFSIHKSMNETCNSLKNNMKNLVSEFRELKACVKESASNVQTEGEDRVREEKDWRSHAEHLIELQEDQRKKEVDRLMLVMELLKLSNAQNPASSTSAKLTQARALQAAVGERTPKSEENNDVSNSVVDHELKTESGVLISLKLPAFRSPVQNIGSPASEIFQSEIKELKASVTDSGSKVLPEGGDQLKEEKEDISRAEHLVQVQEDEGKKQVDCLKLVIEEPKILNERDLTSSNAVKLTQSGVLQATVGDIFHEPKASDDVSKSIVDDNLKIQRAAPISLKLPAFGSPVPIISTSASKDFEELSIDRVNLPVFPKFSSFGSNMDSIQISSSGGDEKTTTSFGSLVKDAEAKSSSLPNFNFASGNKNSQDLYNKQADIVASPTFSGFGSNLNQAQNSSSLFGGNIKPADGFGSFAKVAEAKSGDFLKSPSSSVSTFGCGIKNFQGFPNTSVNFAASPKFSGFGSNLNQAQTSSSLFGGDKKTTTSFGSLAKEAEAKGGVFLNSTSSSMSTFGGGKKNFQVFRK